MSVFECLGRNHKELSEIKNNDYFVLKEDTSLPYLKLKEDENGINSISVLNLKRREIITFLPDTDVIEIELVKFEYKLKVS